jgi:hypothetical protein
MESSFKQAAILANLSALRATLAGALERAADAENTIKDGQINQVIGAATLQTCRHAKMAFAKGKPSGFPLANCVRQ